MFVALSTLAGLTAGMYPIDPLPPVLATALPSNDACVCGDTCTLSTGGSGLCGTDGVCAIFKMAPDCSAVTEAVATTTADTKSCVCGESCVTPDGGSGQCGSDGVTCANFFVAPDCSHVTDVAASTTGSSDYSCVCGQSCVTPDGFSGQCGSDGVTCANFLVPPDCPKPATTTTDSTVACPNGCSGIASRMANTLCDDGSIAGPVCEEPSCEWYIRSCPSATTEHDGTLRGTATVSTSAPATVGQADWCPNSPSIAPYCRLAFCPVDCVAGQECAMRSGDCTCEYVSMLILFASTMCNARS